MRKLSFLFVLILISCNKNLYSNYNCNLTNTFWKGDEEIEYLGITYPMVKLNYTKNTLISTFYLKNECKIDSFSVEYDIQYKKDYIIIENKLMKVKNIRKIQCIDNKLIIYDLADSAVSTFIKIN